MKGGKEEEEGREKKERDGRSELFILELATLVPLVPTSPRGKSDQTGCKLKSEETKVGKRAQFPGASLIDEEVYSRFRMGSKSRARGGRRVRGSFLRRLRRNVTSRVSSS